MIWLFLSILALGLILRSMRIRFYRRHWQHLRAMVTDLANGRRPRSFVFHQAPGFTRVALELEKVYEEQQRLRQTATVQEHSLNAVLASMAEGVVVVDSQRIIRLVNQAFLTLIGLKEDPTGKSILSALRLGDLDLLVRRTFEEQRAQNSELALKAAKSLGDRYLEVNAVPITDPLTGESKVMAVFHDISRLRRLEELRREFVANVSHELKTPLSIFQGYLETMEEPNLTPEQTAEIVGVLKRHSHRLNAILEDLLSLARLEARNEKLEINQIPVGLFLEQLLEDWAPRCSEKDVQLVSEAEPGLQAFQVDPMRLNQVATNLLQNALKYTPAGGKITVRAATTPEGAALIVEDTGIGIPPNDLPHIFERFYRVEKGRDRESGGTGLGLSIVKHIMALHGGRATATSLLGKGTTLCVTFPNSK